MASAALQKHIEQNAGHFIYAANQKNYAKPMFKKEALSQPFMQLNSDSKISTIILDLDYAHSACSWEDHNLPPPTFVIVNPANQHSQIGYGLSAPVCKTEFARRKPLDYLRAIQWALTKRVRGDFNFVGPLSKNPLSADWHLWEPANCPLYELNLLAEYVELPKILPRREPGIGRNCDLFADLARWSYRAIRDFWDKSFDIWAEAVLLKAEDLNTFPIPLAHGELKGIARSVAKYTWRYTTRSGWIKHQTTCGRLGGLASAEARRSQSDAMQLEVLELIEEGRTLSEIAFKLGVNKSTVYRMSKRPAFGALTSELAMQADCCSI
ncbi:replication initiation protein [uncultured Oxalicibacterium sp.]|uniref:replication initiation protein n=1 Tax=uncultured Oxalicibacterium sp. TaxID=1168540 RepID=UPI0025EB5921|nr:replication initiation protein [uncultured Oxalicibacterium sp.]